MIVINCVGPRLIGSRSGEQVAAKRIGSPSPMAKVSGQQPAPPASPRYALVCEYGALLIVIGPLALFTPLLPPVAAGLTFGGLLIAAGLGGAIVFATARRRGLCLATALGGSRHTDRPSRSVPSLDGCFLAAPDTGRRGTLLGLLAVGHGARRRGRRPVAWRWAILAVLLTLGLAGLLVSVAPHGGLMILGLFLAVNLVVFGLSVIAVGLARNAAAEWM